MSLTLDRLYSLIPAVYRIRDVQYARDAGGMLDPGEAAQLAALQALGDSLTAQQEQQLQLLLDKQTRGPLKALMAVIAEQVEVLEESLYRAYDDQFIETCQDWIAPYMGDLVGARNLFVFPNATFSPRAYVADTIGYRRRKGTVPMLELLARDVTGWDANVVEYFQFLATTQYMNHPRPQNLSMADVRNAPHQLWNTPFDPTAHTVDVRNISSRRGKYNIPNIGIFVWRVPDNPMQQSPAFKVDDRRYKFDALGRDTPLFTYSAPVDTVTQRSSPLNVAMPITRAMMRDNLSAYYGLGPGGAQQSVLLQFTGDAISAAKICVCNLEDVTDSSGHVTGWAHAPQNKIGIDPELGRIAFPTASPAPMGLEVNYYYGFSAQMGGGQYTRELSSDANVVVRVPADCATVGAAIGLAVSRLTASAVKATVEIDSNEYYIENLTVSVPSGKTLELRAADQKRPVLVLSQDLVVTGGAASIFQMNGLAVSGCSVSVPLGSGGSNLLSQLQIAHCTLQPEGAPSIGGRGAQPPAPRVWVEAAGVAVTLDHSISGPIRATDECTVTISDSIVDALAPDEVAYAAPDSVSAGGPVTVTNSTLIGKVHTLRITLASNSIFLAEPAPGDLGAGPVHADQLQQGCVRFCFVPSGSQVPRPYRCHPSPDDTVPVFPEFTSLRAGDPFYCQLADLSGPAILQGAADGSEMGAFHDLYQPQRESNLSAALQEYLRFGLQAGIFHAT